MGKRQNSHPLEDNPLIEDVFGSMDSPDDALSDAVRHTVWSILEKADVDARKRKIVWPDGQSLSIAKSVARIHADYPDVPIALIDTHLTAWLEMEFVPPNFSQKQLDELDQLTEKWIDAHERQVEAALKRARTRHS
jgi:hypothetical protein